MMAPSTVDMGAQPAGTWLLVDAGNTRVKWALADAGAPLGQWRVQGAMAHGLLDTLIAEWQAAGIEPAWLAGRLTP